MTPDEWKTITEDVESLWGRSAKWKNSDRSYSYAASVPVAAAKVAIEHLYMEGRDTAPAPATVLSEARKRIDSVVTRDELVRFCEENGHRFGIVDEQNTIRTVVCARCGYEDTKVATLVPTEGEREDGVGGRDVDDSSITDTIAP